MIGLNELENTIGVEPLMDIVAGLNALYGYEAYAYIDTGIIGTDAIRVGLIYRTADVTPVGMYQILDLTDDPTLPGYSRIAPHWRRPSKRTAPGRALPWRSTTSNLKAPIATMLDDPDLGDGAGNCNVTRTLAAQASGGLAGDRPDRQRRPGLHHHGRL